MNLAATIPLDTLEDLIAAAKRGSPDAEETASIAAVQREVDEVKRLGSGYVEVPVMED